MMLSRRLFVLFAGFALAAAPSAAQDQSPATGAGEIVAQAAAAGTKRALVVCGHPGDEEHRKTFADTAARIRQGLIATAGIPAENITLYFGVDPETDPKDQIAAPTEGPATREAVNAAVEKLRGTLQLDDSLWVIVFGHAHLDGRHAWINLPGPDIHQDDFGKLVKDLPCREQVFVVATPASGYYLKALSRAGRVVMTATEPDIEINETLFAEALADQLNPTAENPLRDEDGDGAISLLDLYIATTRGVVQKYTSESLLATEHSLLDDNGDGRGSELQRDYLTAEEGGRRRAGSVPPLTRRPGQDGTAAAALRLPVAVPPPGTPAAKESSDSPKPAN